MTGKNNHSSADKENKPILHLTICDQTYAVLGQNGSLRSHFGPKVGRVLILDFKLNYESEKCGFTLVSTILMEILAFL